MLAIDANVWVYYLDSDLAEHKAVRRPMDDAIQDRTLFLSTAIEMEVVHYLVNQLDDPEPYTERFLHLDDVSVASLVPGDIERGVELLLEHPHAGIGGRDASLVATMERREVDVLWTHDGGLKRLDDRLDWLTVEDPVE